MIAFLAFAIPLSLYLRVPSCFWNFDGVACAAALELGQPTYFFHSNHLLYGFFGFLFWKCLGQPFGISRALPALQLFTSILAALGLAGLYFVLGPVVKNRWSALVLTCGMAFTAAFWVWSIEVQVYALAFLALAWANVALLRTMNQPKSRKYIGVGILHGAAVLGHLMHFLWAVPALWWMVNECREERSSLSRALKQYFASLAIVTVIPYLLVIHFIVAPGRDRQHIMTWLKGSVGLTKDKSWSWHWGGWSAPWLWLKSTAPSLWGIFWPYEGTHRTSLMWLLAGVSMALFFLFLVRAWRERSDRLFRFSWTWLGVYGLFLSTWEPQTLCYRMPDVIPLGILLALGLRTLKTTSQLVLVTLFLGSTLTLNLLSLAQPMHNPGLNATYQETIALSKSTPADSLYITGGGLSWIYLLYFTGRTAWNERSLDGSQLSAELIRQKRDHPVFIQSRLLSDPVLAQPLSTLKWKQGNEGYTWLQAQ